MRALRMGLDTMLRKGLEDGGRGRARVDAFIAQLKSMEDKISYNASIYDASWKADKGNLRKQLLTAIDKDLEEMVTEGVGEVATWLYTNFPNGPPSSPTEIDSVPPVPEAAFFHTKRALDTVNGIVATQTSVDLAKNSTESSNPTASTALGKRKASSQGTGAQNTRAQEVRHHLANGLRHNGCILFWKFGRCANLDAGNCPFDHVQTQRATFGGAQGGGSGWGGGRDFGGGSNIGTGGLGVSAGGAGRGTRTTNISRDNQQSGVAQNLAIVPFNPQTLQGGDGASGQVFGSGQWARSSDGRNSSGGQGRRG